MPDDGRVRFWSADWHLGHSNIIRYCARPFTSAEEMDEAIIGRMNRDVGPDDELWVLGDVAMGKIAETLPLVARVHGRKTLVAGNHDRCWAGHTKNVDQWIAEYLAAGFEAVVQGTATATIGGRPVLVSHFPYQGDSQERNRFEEYRPTDTGQVLLHGHVHEKWRKDGRQINVGVDAWGGRPVPDEELATLIDSGPEQLAPLPWDVGGRAPGA